MNRFSRNLSRAGSQNEPVSGKRVLYVHKNRCPENHPCPAIRVCPAAALTQDRYSAPVVDMEKCVSCGKCVRYCPMGAIRLIPASS
jgi:Fe-S-cluster-containing hydrogenase component 2